MNHTFPLNQHLRNSMNIPFFVVWNVLFTAMKLKKEILNIWCLVILRFALRCSLHHAANYPNVNSFYLIETADIVSMINTFYVFLFFTGHFYPNQREDPLIPELPIETFNVKPGRFYRFRVINAAMLFSFRFSIDEVNTPKYLFRNNTCLSIKFKEYNWPKQII